MSLHFDAVSGDLRKLLGELLSAPELECFALAGGTSLALRRGHRVSVDIDLFIPESFDAERLREILDRQFPLENVAIATNSLSGTIEGIKVDLLAHRYPQLEPVETIDRVRMISLPDLAAMKLNAIHNRGAKKDFWDLAELLSLFPMEDLLDFHRRKYPNASEWSLVRSLAYFDDADREPDPQDLAGKSWTTIKDTILRHAPAL